MQATAIVIFGATGDLAQTKLFPTLYRLMGNASLEQELYIVAIGRRPYTEEVFRTYVREHLEKRVELEEERWHQFADRLTYYQMDFTEEAGYPGLCQQLGEAERNRGICNRLFYLAVPPESYQEILTHIHTTGLHQQSEGRWRRIVVEKPFGHNLASAMELNQRIRQLFDEEQIYRIDHYLAKETVQNLLAFRFANGIFEPLWNKEHVDHIQITVAEEEGIRNRGAYYDRIGAFRDIVQNHLLQLLALLTMEEPVSFSFQELSNEKAKILSQLVHDPARTIFGQYATYRSEPGVAPESTTESYAMTCLGIDSNRWSGVPIYLRTGKQLARRISEVSIQFRASHQHLFRQAREDRGANVLTFRLQPDEGISLRLGVKTPRENLEVQPVQMEFCYSTTFRMQLPDAYERLFFDVLMGDKTLSLREDSIELSWSLVDRILAEGAGKEPLFYDSGSWGPAQADEILAVEGRHWLAHESTVCNGVVIDTIA